MVLHILNNLNTMFGFVFLFVEEVEEGVNSTVGVVFAVSPNPNGLDDDKEVFDDGVIKDMR